MQEAQVAPHSIVAKVALTALLASATLAVVATAPPASARYYMVDELLARDLSSWGSSELKIHGWVMAGSIKEKVVDLEINRTFILHKGGKKIRVFTKGPAPDTFKDQSELVAIGTLVPAASMEELAGDLEVRLEADMPYVLDASDLRAKCTTRYDASDVVNRNLKYE